MEGVSAGDEPVVAVLLAGSNKAEHKEEESVGGFRATEDSRGLQSVRLIGVGEEEDKHGEDLDQTEEDDQAEPGVSANARPAEQTAGTFAERRRDAGRLFAFTHRTTSRRLINFRRPRLWIKSTIVKCLGRPIAEIISPN